MFTMPSLYRDYEGHSTPTSKHYDIWRPKMDIAQLKLRKEELLRQITVDMERLRKLKMVKMYRTKNDLSELHDLIDKWNAACQTAIEELHGMTSEPKPPMGKLISDWNVNPQLVRFDVETDSFL